ncbi:hypothetical protein [Deinococcus sp. AJ005]|uniref:hypothetical protein n=1 Tax=Deinococcus sp. AJ005 TaxID=2652443 RepID=UPI001CF6A820|nr:hypothetical protein [Deinococcus sp. AJ005]
MKVGLLLLALLLLLGACRPPQPDPQAAPQIAALSARIGTLETEVAELKAGQRDSNLANSDDVTARAAAQNCAIALARALELFRQGSLESRYPTPSQVDLPDACEDQRVGWQKLEAQQYTFAVTNGDGQVLAQQSEP